MRFSNVLIAFGTVCVSTWAMTVRADWDVKPSMANGQLMTNGHDDGLNIDDAGRRVFFYDLGSDVGYTTNDPGFNAEPGSGLPQGSVLGFKVMTNVQYWNGQGSVSFRPIVSSENVLLQSYNDDIQPPPILSQFTVGSGTGYQPGFVVAPVGADGVSHRHIFSTLQGGGENGPATGVYLVEERLHLLSSEETDPAQQVAYPGVQDSLPYFMLYNNGTDELTTFLDAQTWVQEHLVPFGDFNRDGITTVADVSAMMIALSNLSKYETDNQLTNELLEGFGDINGDGKVNNGDIQELICYLANGGTGGTGDGTGGAVTIVPEPATGLLMAIGAVAGLLVVRRRLLRRC